MPEHMAGAAAVALLTSSVALAAAPSATTARSPWRLIAGLALTRASLDTIYASRYSPPFLYTTYWSEATQLLPLDAGSGPGARLAIERDVAPHFGVRIAADYAAAGTAGAAGRYDLTMRYVSRPPPAYEPVYVVQERSLEWPGATGRLESFAVSLDVVAWAPLGATGRVGVAAGPAWLRTRGRAESLIYTVYRMGGHSTSFYEDLLVAFTFPADALALDAGVFVERNLGTSLGLRLDLGYRWSPGRDAPVTVDELVNAEQVVNALAPAEIQAGLDPAPVRLDPSMFRASLVLVVRF